MKKILIVIITLLIVLSCKKEKPPTGNYIGVFHYQYISTVADKSILFKIAESKKDFFIFKTTDFMGNITNGSDTIFKNNNKINGRIHVIDGAQTSYQISGELSKKRFKRTYLMKGTFTSTSYYQGGVLQIQNSGTFEIKSN